MVNRTPRRTAAALGVAVLSAIAVLTATAVDAESVAPPTPRGVQATTIGGDGGGAQLGYDGEQGSLQGTSASRSAWASSAAARSGERGLRISSNNAPGYVRWNADRLPSARSHAAVRMWVRLHHRSPGESVDLLTVANSRNSRNFDFFVSGPTGRFQWDLFRNNTDRSNFVVQRGRWYLVEVNVEFAGTTHSAAVRIDGVHQGTISSSGTNQRVDRISVGSFSNKTHTQDYDDLAVDFGSGPVPWIAPGGGAMPSQVRVSWNGVVDAGSGLREYQIWRNGRWYGWVPAGTTTYVDRSPVAGARYQLRAVDRDLNRSGWSSPALPQ